MAVTSKTEDLEILLAVVDSGSFSAAARVLNQQVAKVSRSVSRLESALNCTLLNRTTRRLELTEEGHSFIRYVREGLNTLERGEEALRLLKQAPAGRLRVDAASPFIRTLTVTPGYHGGRSLLGRNDARRVGMDLACRI